MKQRTATSNSEVRLADIVMDEESWRKEAPCQAVQVQRDLGGSAPEMLPWYLTLSPWSCQALSTAPRT